MKTKLLLLVTAVLALGADSPRDEAAVKEVEKAIGALNTAFEKRDGDTIKRLMTRDHVAVTPYYGGPQTPAEQVQSLGDLKLSEYKTGKVRVQLLGPDAALVTYTLTMKGSFRGKELAAKSFASATWVRRDGKWLEVFYQETALDGR